MSILRYILLGYGFLALFIAGGIFFKGNSTVNKTIAVFVCLFGLEIFEFLYSTSEIVLVYPRFYGIYYFPAGFLYGPVLLLHIQVLLDKKKALTYLDFFHFIPAIIITISMFDIFLMDPLERINYTRTHFYGRIMNMNYARAVHLLIYGMLIVTYVYKRRSSLIPKEKIYSIAICSIYFLATVLISWLTCCAENWRQFIVFYFVAYTVILIIGYLLYTDPEFLKEISKKYLNSALSNKDMNRIYKKIQETFSKDKIFLNRDLSLAKFSEIIEEKPHSISQTMSELVQQNFNDYLNFHRVQHAMEMLRDPKFGHYKIEAVAIDSGFNNKVTFNKAFLKCVKSTPSTYRKEQMIK